MLIILESREKSQKLTSNTEITVKRARMNPRMHFQNRECERNTIETI